MSALASWFSENKLILNLKKGKTEAMIFGTGKRLSMTPTTLNIMYLDNAVNVTTTYKYLGVQLDQTLTLSDQFDTSYKKTSLRLFLLNKLRNLLTIEASRAIYNSMVLPVITYCCLVNLHNTETQVYKLTSLENRAKLIINTNDQKIISIVKYKQ